MEYAQQREEKLIWVLVILLVLSFLLSGSANKNLIIASVVLNIAGGTLMVIMSRNSPKNYQIISLLFAITWFYSAYASYINLRVLP